MALALAAGIWRSLSRMAKKSRPTPEEANSIISELPRSVQVLVLSRIRLPQLFAVPSLSRAWRATFTMPYFRALLDRTHPKMIAIVGFRHRFRLTIVMFDLASHQWHYRVLRNPTYESSWGYRVSHACVAHDEGLLCFVASGRKKACPIVVCNPLTNEWKVLPFPETWDSPWNPIIVRLEVNVTTHHYKVTVVHEYLERSVLMHAAEVYDSATNLWSKKEDGVVSGLEFYHQLQISNCFNCSTRKAYMMLEHHVARPRPGQGAEFVTAGVRGQRYFKLYHRQSQDTYRVSEYVLWTVVDGSGVARRINSYDSSLQLTSHPGHVSLMATERFLLLLADNCKVEGQRRRQQTIYVRDQVAGTWHQIPALKKKYSGTKMKKYFMCELRWNATP